MVAPTVMFFVGLTLPTASQPPFPPETGTLLSLRDISPNRGITLKGTASLGSPFKGSCQTEGLTEGSFCILHFALYHASAFKRSGKCYLIGIFKVCTNGYTVSKSADRNAHGLQKS